MEKVVEEVLKVEVGVEVERGVKVRVEADSQRLLLIP